MVNHKNMILDAGEIKICPEVIEMSKPKHVYEFEKLMFEMNMKFEERDAYHRNNIRVYPYSGWKHEHNQKIYDCLCREADEQEEDKYMMKYRYETFVPKCFWNTKEMCDYMNVIPFIPSVMINVSPDWAAVEHRTDSQKVNLLSTIIERYLAEGSRYSKASYVIENGSDGTHIHAHVVAEFNPLLKKAVNTHLAKGTHSQQLIKQANKVKGMKGMLKGVGIQKVFLRKKELVEDKLKYLIEEEKPEGHKNHSVIFEKKDLVF